MEGEDWADSTNCDPGKEGQKVREFAQKINLAARNVERVKAERAASVRELTKRLAAVETDRSAIEQSKQARTVLGTDPMVPLELPPGSADAPTAKSA